MAKHLIYLGYTGTAHRVALFDEADFLVKSLPTKDVPVLSDDLEFLNCTVINGVPIPNLLGAKVICTPKEGSQVYSRFSRGTKVSLSDLQAFVDKNPTYTYGLIDGTVHRSGVYFSQFNEFSFWDGTCTDKTMYMIAEVAVYKTPKRNSMTGSILCMNSTGDLFFMTSNTVRVLEKAGAVFVQVGTPKLNYPNCFSSTREIGKDSIIVGMGEEQYRRVYWVNRRGQSVKEEANREAEFIWWGGGKKTTVCDLRRYKKAKVFGISSCAEDAAVVILPETAEDIWLGMFYECTSLKAVYITKNVQRLHELGLPPRRFNGVTIYSSSPIVEAFCKEKQVQYQKCEDAEEMLKHYYGGSEEYISISDAGAIAGLTANASDKSGESGTVWSAVLFSCADKGMALEELRRRYPVIETCDLPIPQNAKPAIGAGSVGDQGEYSKERTRTLAAALTQFYPLYTGKYDNTNATVYKCPLGDYELYMTLDVLRKDKLPPPDRQYQRDSYINHHIAELVDTRKGRVIHRFEATDIFYLVMKNLQSACMTNAAPSGVLRYADKLPVTSLTNGYGNRGDAEALTFAKELLNSFLMVVYGVKNTKTRLAGIDLYTGDIVMLDIYKHYGIRTWTRQDSTPSATLAGVHGFKSLKRYTEDDPVAHIFARKCEYLKKEREKN